MSIFGYSSEAAPVKDIIGGNFEVPKTDVYPITLGHVYTTKTSKGGTAITIIGKYEDGTEFKKTIYPTSTKSGVEKNTYLGKDNKPVYLADFLHFDALCLLVLGKPASEVTTEDKMVKIFDNDLKKEVPKKVATFVDFNGKQVLLALTRVLKTKQKIVGDTYVDAEGTRTEQNLDKVFRYVDRKTVTEVSTQSDATYMDAWLAKYQGKDKDLTTKQSGVAGAPEAPAMVKPLF